MQMLENLFRIFSEKSVFRLMSKTILLENSLNSFNTLPNKKSFPVIRSVSCDMTDAPKFSN